MSVFRNLLADLAGGGTQPYTELEYIESDGTQLIDTLITPTISNKLEIDYQLLANTTNTMAFGTRQSWTKNGFFACADNNVIGNTWYLQFSNKFLKVGTTDTQRHTLIFALPSSTNSNYFDVIEDNNKIGTFIYPSNFSGITPIYLFGAYDGDASGTNKYLCSAYKFYYCKIYDGENLVRDYIPVLDSHNVPCLYDKVSGDFFYNIKEGASAFTYGTLS